MHVAAPARRAPSALPVATSRGSRRRPPPPRSPSGRSPTTVDEAGRERRRGGVRHLASLPVSSIGLVGAGHAGDSSGRLGGCGGDLGVARSRRYSAISPTRTFGTPAELAGEQFGHVRRRPHSSAPDRAGAHACDAISTSASVVAISRAHGEHSLGARVAQSGNQRRGQCESSATSARPRLPRCRSGSPGGRRGARDRRAGIRAADQCEALGAAGPRRHRAGASRHRRCRPPSRGRS